MSIIFYLQSCFFYGSLSSFCSFYFSLIIPFFQFFVRLQNIVNFLRSHFHLQCPFLSMVQFWVLIGFDIDSQLPSLSLSERAIDILITSMESQINKIFVELRETLKSIIKKLETPPKDVPLHLVAKESMHHILSSIQSNLEILKVLRKFDVS